jgi:hypothetical protein
MNEKIFLNGLTTDGVTVIKQKYTTIEGVDYNIGEQWAKGYANSTQGRQEVQAEVIEPYLSAVMAMWGDSPTVTVETISSTQ